MDAELEFTDQTPEETAEAFREFQAVLPEHLEAAAEEIALRVQADAMRGTPVDTGRLRASIDHEVEQVVEHTVRAAVGTNVEYAPLVEIDDPYLRPAFESNREFIRQRVGEAIEAAWEDVT